MYDLIFMILASASLIFSLLKLLDALKLMKKYALVKEKVLQLKLQNNSKIFIIENLISEGFDKYLVKEVVEELFANSIKN